MIAPHCCRGRSRPVARSSSALSHDRSRRPGNYTGSTINAAHRGLGITSLQFAAVANHQAASLTGTGIPGGIFQIIGFVSTLKDDIAEDARR